MKIILTIISFAVYFTPTWGQSVIASGGQSASSSTMQASATIGESIIGSNSTAGIAANQGFQQPLQTDLSTSIYDPKGQLIDVMLSPNPVIDKVKLSFSKSIENIRLTIYSSTGSLIKTYNYQGTRSVLEENLSDLESGTYYINMVDQLGRILGSLPIIKI